MFRNNKRGSMTVEACIILPVFICAVVSVLFLIKLVYVHEIIQHSINEAAWEMAASSYIYQASGIRELHDMVREGLDKSAEEIKEKIAGILEAAEALGAGDLLPPEKYEAITGLVAEGAFNKVKSMLAAPLARLLTEKYISDTNADERLRALNVKNGCEGLDFSQSCFFRDEAENIEIVVSYEIELPLPFNVLPDLKIVQRAVSKAWLSGDLPEFLETGEPAEASVWSMGNLERGAAIRNAFGANLPYSYPVISTFENGWAIMIKSMNLMAESYREPKNVFDTVTGYVDELSEFIGTEQPWGSSKIEIREEDIKNRKLLLVIPENELAEEVEAVLEQCGANAEAKGVLLQIERFGLAVQ